MGSHYKGPGALGLRLFEGVLGTLKSPYRVYSRYVRIPGLRAHTRGPWFQPLIKWQVFLQGIRSKVRRSGLQCLKDEITPKRGSLADHFKGSIRVLQGLGF